MTDYRDDWQALRRELRRLYEERRDAGIWPRKKDGTFTREGELKEAHRLYNSGGYDFRKWVQLTAADPTLPLAAKAKAYLEGNPRYNHAFEVAFEVISDTEDGSDITHDMLEEALINRAKQLTADDEWKEAADLYDTYEMED